MLVWLSVSWLSLIVSWMSVNQNNLQQNFTDTRQKILSTQDIIPWVNVAWLTLEGNFVKSCWSR